MMTRHKIYINLNMKELNYIRYKSYYNIYYNVYYTLCKLEDMNEIFFNY